MFLCILLDFLPIFFLSSISHHLCKLNSYLKKKNFHFIPRLNIDFPFQRSLFNLWYFVSVAINWTKKLKEVFLVSENANGLPTGTFFSSHKDCSHAVQLYGEKLNSSQILLKWSLPTSNGSFVISNVIFR